ncbi:hypothetical protein E1212_00715 [Jiangella ureilytica]|uniref:Uncharacterized protein n=1 Tax=Jiangella ureilytica TaxID=2530374 RepID=A0A4R4S778_9ACTN|nr:hypothetical protein [Jiangella ureilytica]TDC57013.1 hypothetical protein E1212_00715 [Jiangella ureilytica]
MTKTRADKRRAKRRAAHSHRDASPILFTDRHRDHLMAAMVAEQDGDLETALAHLRRTPHRRGSGWERQLAELVTLGERAEPWQWARFAVAAAQRWVAGVPSPLAARIEREIRAGAGDLGAPNDPALPWRLRARQITVSRTVADSLLFDELLLELFLVRVAPELERRAGGGRGWAMAPGRVYELGEVTGVELRVRDRSAGEQRVVRHLGEAVGTAPGSPVYGRLLDVPGAPGTPATIFASAPLVVDEPAARRLEHLIEEDTHDLTEWGGALGAAARSGAEHLPPPPDLDGEPAAGVRLLMDQGLDRVAAELFALVQSLVAMHAIDPGSTPVYAHHAAVALADPAVEAEVGRRLVGPSYAEMWRSFAAAAHGLDRERFLALAAASLRDAADQGGR